MDSSDVRVQLDERRLLLFSTRIRFMPQTQPIRETAIDKILEQNLLLADSPLAVREIQKHCLDLNGRPILSRADVEASLGRLSGRSLRVEGTPEQRYSLLEQRRQELWNIQETAEANYRAIVNRLFKGSRTDVSTYSHPFLECLSLIFSRLGEAYVKHIKREISGSDLMALANVRTAVADTKRHHPKIDEHLFQSAIQHFFDEADPKYDQLKWNLAQNYYVSKALGLDAAGTLLTKELYGNASFYIDTNVLVHALDSTGRHHNSFKALTEACGRLGIRLLVSRISIDEMRRVAALEKELLARRVAERIPSALLAKMRGILLPSYLQQVESEGSCDLDALFNKFDKPSAFLKSDYGIDVIDDEWFIHAAEDTSILKLVDQLKAAYFDSTGRKKGERAALHDALMICWIAKERDSLNPSTWFVTLDMSLPAFRHDRQQSCPPYAITLVGLMQWLSPITTEGMEEDQAAAIFGEALKQQLLPRETFFELRDFLVFSEMEMQTELLPARDVEECIQKLKEHAPNLDPTDPRDREKLAHEISKFFVDTGRQFKVHLDEQRTEIRRLTADFQTHKNESEAELRELKGQITRKDSDIVTLSDKLRVAQVRGEATLRLLLTGSGFVITEGLIGYVALRFAEGENAVQKITKSWPLFAIVLSAWVIISWFVVGRERLVALGWPFTKLLRAEENVEAGE